MLDLNREWLETNGLGGFASSTLSGINTRRYHGLLTAATTPPVGRMLLLSKLEETLIVNGRRYEFATNQYPGTVYPEGFRYLRDVRFDPFPEFFFEVEGTTVRKRVFMVHGENTTVIEYEVGGGASLELRPLFAFRDYHSTAHANSALNPDFEAQPGRISFRPYEGVPRLYLAHTAEVVERGAGWYRDFEFAMEQERGLDFREDLFNPVVLKCAGSVTIIASMQPRDARDGAVLRAREIERRRQVAGAAPGPDPLVRALTAAADQFVVEREGLQTIIAGYHWFADWGRDTMISLPGLTLVTGRYDVARRILQAFAQHLDQGMLPNRFPDAGEAPEYNTVDATLWFFEAVRAYLKYSGDYAFVQGELYAALKDSIDWHLRGTRYGIKVDRDALLTCGESGVQLTWMDAKVGDWVVTPRYGKPVEVQALWYNALRIMQDLAERFGDRSAALFLRELAEQARESFQRRFWNEATGCLYDVVNGEERDGSVRPNQIFAISLHHAILEDAGRARRVVDVVERELLTPMGLRSLSLQDSRYRPRYEGDPLSRDSAYHQGTVWPWLMGPFLTAYVKVKGCRKQAMERLRGFVPGQIPEIADGDAPHTPRGCIAQAWSVAEILRAAVEDVSGARSEH